MIKRIVIVIFMLCIPFLLCGCTEKEENNKVDEVINSIKNDEDYKGETNSNSSDEITEDIKLYSDDTRMVFKFNDISTIVFYYEGDVITNLEYYYDYGTKETATIAKSTIINANEKDIEKVEQNGSYIIVKYKKEYFEDMTVEEIKQSYSYLEQIYE